jgi:hypothetical protein
LCSVALGMSLMYSRNNNGSQIGPCSTPYVIFMRFGTLLEFRCELLI